MFEFLKTKGFNTVFSFILGLGLVALLKPFCHGAACVIQKAPPVEEVSKTTYQLGSKCYQFKSEPVDCPADGVIESFFVYHIGPQPQ
jgi:hypothetical protein